MISPLLSNIYLDQLDKHVESVLIPRYSRGQRHRENPAYRHLSHEIQMARKEGAVERVHALALQRRQLASIDPRDPEYRRLRYVRYADDFLLGWTGPKAEAEEIKAQLKEYLGGTLHLDLSDEKTVITHARTQRAHFLSYDLHVMHADDKLTSGRRSVNGGIALTVPRHVITATCSRYTRQGTPIHRLDLVHDSDYAIVHRYQAEYRGLVQYYPLATNVARLGRVRYVMALSLLKTLAHKHRSTLQAMAVKYRAMKDTPHGPRRCFRVIVPRGDGKPPLVAEFGGIALRRNPRAHLVEKPWTIYARRTDLLSRLLADTCEVCGHHGACQVHHIHKLADLRKPGKKPLPLWVQHMLAMRRKTLVVCRPCHVNIHAGRPTRQRIVASLTGEPDALKSARPVWREADGKGAPQ